jgi:hypothetical protein
MDRLSLHDILLSITTHVYFQPPESKKLEFPCIVYKRSDVSTRYADDSNYMSSKQYMVTVIDPNPDSLLPSKVGKLPRCRFVRFFTKDNLNHDIYNLYY